MIIYKALLKYGYSGFKLEILEYCNQMEEVLTREQYYLDLLKPEYNILKQAGSSLGFRHTEETRALMSISAKNKPAVSEETKVKLREIAQNRFNILKKGNRLGSTHTHSEETKAKMAESAKNRVLSKETKAKLSEIAKNRVLTEETKAKLSEIAKNRVLTEETKARVSKMHTYRSKESKEKDVERLKEFSRARSRPVEVTNVLTNETIIYSSISQAASGLDVYPNSVRNALKSGKLIKKTYKTSYVSKDE
jgi:hypothetical protein